MKLRLASLATGLSVTLWIIITVLFVRALFKDNASVTFLVWFLAWPLWIVRCVPGIPANAMIWVSLAIGFVLDILFISLATYFVLRAIVSRQKRARIAMPPQPPAF